MHNSLSNMVCTRRELRQIGLWVLTVLALAGCAQMPTPSATLASSTHFTVRAPAARQQALAKINSFALTGVLGVQSAGQAPLVLRTTWRHDPAEDEIVVTAALGLSHRRVLITGQTVRVFQGKQCLTTGQLGRVLTEALGWPLPVVALRGWVLGKVSYADRAVRYDRYGHLVHLSRAGWQVDLSQYNTLSAVDLPHRLVLSRAEVTLTLAVTRWDL
jgi:outer membrane lipoprotein LolB